MAEQKVTWDFSTKRLWAGIIAWGLYLILMLRWIFVAADGVAVLWDLGVVAAMTLAAGVLTIWWVRHNVAIYQQKGPRLRSTRVAAPWSHDFRGRPLVVNVAEVQTAKLIRVSLGEDGTKSYQVEHRD